jgi:pyocin large subunit-like protein
MIGGWAKRKFDDTRRKGFSRLANIEHHFGEHGAEVGAKNMKEYIKKAASFRNNLKRAVPKSVKGGTRWMKGDQYIILDKFENIVSFGKQ